MSIQVVPVARTFTSARLGSGRSIRERRRIGARRQGMALLAWMLATAWLAASIAAANPGIMPAPVPSDATPTPGAAPTVMQVPTR